MLPEEDVQLEIDPDPELEREAEETAQRVMSGGKLGIQKLSDADVHVQRALDRFNPLSGSSESESFDSASVDELARRLEVVEQNQAALFESMAGDGAESGDVNLEALVDGDQKGALEKVGEAGTYGALGELVKAGGTEALKQGAIWTGLATAGSVGLPVALAAGVVAATAAGGTSAMVKNRGSVIDRVKNIFGSEDERDDMNAKTRDNVKF
ncbi:hypothetical protein RYH80_12100 [Halobaculum sp. MBLA0147]|uniref:hypothetical protein n=1 Tax=Halobaculum sp. MBLA0147 TaxID=3079934 RepID=UPI00352345A9